MNSNNIDSNTNASASEAKSFEALLNAYVEALESVTVRTRYRGGDNWTPSNLEDAAQVILATGDLGNSAAEREAREIVRQHFEPALSHLDYLDPEREAVRSELEDIEAAVARDLDESEGMQAWELLGSHKITVQPAGWGDMDSSEKVDLVEVLTDGERWAISAVISAIDSMPAAPDAD